MSSLSNTAVGHKKRDLNDDDWAEFFDMTENDTEQMVKLQIYLNKRNLIFLRKMTWKTTAQIAF